MRRGTFPACENPVQHSPADIRIKMTLSIGVDAFNISMPKGSGVATYGFNLNHSLRELGFETHLLYGPEQGPGKNALVNEMGLFDAPTPPSPSRYLTSLVRSLKSLTSPLG